MRIIFGWVLAMMLALGSESSFGQAAARATNETARPANSMDKLTGAFTKSSTNAASATNEMVIEADGGFVYEAPTAVYRVNVHVTDPQMEMFCEQLTVYFQTNNNRIDLIVAETNVVIIEKDNWAIGDKAVYTATNDLVEVTGHVLLDTPRGYLVSDLVMFDRKKNKVSVPGAIKMGGKIERGTNSPLPSVFGGSERTNAPPMTPIHP